MPLLMVPNFAPPLDASVVDPARLPLPPSMVRTDILPYAPVALYTRRITRVDDPWLPVALDIWKRSFPERDRAPLSKWVGLLNEYADGQTSSRCLLTATPAGDTRPVGMAYYEVRRGRDGEAPVGYLVYLATDPGYRGQGMGTLLYRDVIARLFAAGCRAVVFEVEMPSEVGRLCVEEGELARRRMAWYRRNGARQLSGAVAVAGIGGPQPLPEAILIHARPGDPAEHSCEAAFACACTGLGAAAVERTNEPLTLS